MYPLIITGQVNMGASEVENFLAFYCWGRSIDMASHARKIALLQSDGLGS